MIGEFRDAIGPRQALILLLGLAMIAVGAFGLFGVV